MWVRLSIFMTHLCCFSTLVQAYHENAWSFFEIWITDLTASYQEEINDWQPIICTLKNAIANYSIHFGEKTGTRQRCKKEIFDLNSC